MFGNYLVSTTAFLAQVESRGSLSLLGQHLLAAIIFSLVGIVVFFLCLLLIEKLAPFSIVKEIAEDQNEALGTIIGAMVLGISIIIAAAIVG